MTTSAQRATLVLEHVSATEDEEQVGDDEWCVVAYLVYDSGRRDRATLSRCGTREEAAETLSKMWQSLTR